MTKNKQDYYSFAEFTEGVKSFIVFLRKKWLLFVLCMMGSIGLSILYYFSQKPQYKAITTFILEDKNPSGGGLAGLASQFGLNLGSLTGGGSLFAGDNILSILKSKKVVQKVLLSRESTDTNARTLADIYLDFHGYREKWKKNPKLAGINFNGPMEMMSPLQDSILNVIHTTIIKKDLQTTRISKQSSIIEVEVTSQNSLFARLLAERLVEEASSLYLNIKVGMAETNIAQMKYRSDSLLVLLNRKSFTAASSQPIDVNPALRSAVVPAEIATRDKTVLATLYTEVTKNLEASKMILSQQTPVIQLLDRPSFLLNDNKKGLFFLLMVFLIITASIYIGLSFLVFFIVRKPSKTDTGIAI